MVTDEVVPAATSDEHFLGSITSDDETEPWFVSLPLCGNSVKLKIDTGPDILVMSHATWQMLKNRPVLRPTSEVLSNPGGKPKCCGEFTAKTTWKDTRYQFKV